MKVVLKTQSTKYDGDRHDFRVFNSFGTEVNRHIIQSLHECPEDACIGRDLVDGDDLIKVMRLAYEAGKNGEPFEVEEIEVSPDGDF